MAYFVNFSSSSIFSRAQISQTQTLWLLAAGLGFAFLMFFIFWLSWRKESKVIRSILEGTNGKKLERALVDHFRTSERLEAAVTSLERRISVLESRAKKDVSSVGIIRYNAFQEMGGKQSFALALQNDLGDGIVINCITGRESVRFFCKPIENGKCEVGLTPEEEAAIRLARRWQHPEQSG